MVQDETSTNLKTPVWLEADRGCADLVVGFTLQVVTGVAFSANNLQRKVGEGEAAGPARWRKHDAFGQPSCHNAHMVVKLVDRSWHIVNSLLCCAAAATLPSFWGVSWYEDAERSRPLAPQVLYVNLCYQVANWYFPMYMDPTEAYRFYLTSAVNFVPLPQQPSPVIKPHPPLGVVLPADIFYPFVTAAAPPAARGVGAWLLMLQVAAVLALSMLLALSW